MDDQYRNMNGGPRHSLDRGRGEGVVRLGGRDSLDKLAQVSLVVDQLLLLVVDNVGTDIVQESRVVRDDHARHLAQATEILFEPSDGLHVQVIGRLIQQENVGSNQHGSSELELHLPTTRQRSDGVCLLLVGETDREEHGGDLGLCSANQSLVGGNKVDNGDRSVFALQSVLHHQASELVLRREALDLAKMISIQPQGKNTTSDSPSDLGWPS